MKTLFTLGIIGSLAIITINAHAQAGALDPSFSGDGIEVNFIGSNADVGLATAIQQDGKIIVAGFTNNSGTNDDFAILRYNTDGTIDNTFGTGGVVTTDFAGDNDKCLAVKIQSDGKIVAAGFCYIDTIPDFALARYNTDGSLDMTFDLDGKVTTDLGNSRDDIEAMALQSDGKIVVAGFSNVSSSYDFAVARYNSNGSLDNTFSTNGWVTTDFTGSSFDYAHAVCIQSDGKILVCGATDDSTNADYGIVRYTTTGALDASFGSGGKVITDFGTTNDVSYSIAVQPDGKIITAGSVNISGSYDFALVRYNSNGTLDASFDSDGKTFIDFGDYDMCRALMLQADGKIITAGVSYVSLQGEFALARLNSDGSPDPSFNSDGTVLTTIGITDDEIYGIALQSDGKIIAAGTSQGSSYDFAVARYDAAGSVDVFENNTSITLSAFPNPCTNKLIVKGTSGSGELIITDITGKEVFAQKTSAAETSVDAESLAPGYYTINYHEKDKMGNIKFGKY